MNGCVHIYTGKGKGKTTAAVGLCARCAGWGKKVAFYEFLKGDATGEVKALTQLGVMVYCSVKTEKFVFVMTEQEKCECIERQKATLQNAIDNMHKYDMVVLDEVLSAIDAGVLSVEQVVNAIDNKAPETELVLTGANSSQGIIARADYVSEMMLIKHPYSKGQMARKGIEY